MITWWSTERPATSKTPHGYLNIDGTAPVTSATNLAPDAGSGWTNATPQSVTLSATDGAPA